MTQLLSEIISAVLQIALLSLIPFLFFLFRKDKKISFFKYIGLTGTTPKAIWLSIAASVFFLTGALILMTISADLRRILTTPPSVTGKLREIGLQPYTVATLLIIACFKTAFSEEIFFRGFIAKGCMKTFGFREGNIAQSLIFGFLHLILFWTLTKAGWVFLILIFSFSFVSAFIVSIINEKYGNGSIIPGWIAHGLGNTISYFIIAFVI